MANIAATDVTVTINKRRRGMDSRSLFNVTLAFGDGALTYPAGGIPITKAKLGCPTIIESLHIVDKGTAGYEFNYDSTNEKIVMIQAPVQTHTHDLSVAAAAVADGTGTRVLGASNILSTLVPGGYTVTGGGTAGGIASTVLAAAAGTQPSAVAIAAQTIICEIIGW